MDGDIAHEDIPQDGTEPVNISKPIKRLDVEFLLFSYFSLIEPRGEVIDVQRSFASKQTDTSIILLIRIALLLWSFISIVWGAFADNDEYFFLAYLSNWTAVVSLSYLTLSLCLPILLIHHANNPKIKMIHHQNLYK